MAELLSVNLSGRHGEEGDEGQHSRQQAEQVALQRRLGQGSRHQALQHIVKGEGPRRESQDGQGRREGQNHGATANQQRGLLQADVVMGCLDRYLGVIFGGQIYV